MQVPQGAQIRAPSRSERDRRQPSHPSTGLHLIELHRAGTRQGTVWSFCNPERCPTGLAHEVAPRIGGLLGSQLGKRHLFSALLGLCNTEWHKCRDNGRFGAILGELVGARRRPPPELRETDYAQSYRAKGRAPKSGLQPNWNLHRIYFSRCERTDLLPSASAAKLRWGAATALTGPQAKRKLRDAGRRPFAVRCTLALAGPLAI